MGYSCISLDWNDTSQNVSVQLTNYMCMLLALCCMKDLHTKQVSWVFTPGEKVPTRVPALFSLTTSTPLNSWVPENVTECMWKDSEYKIQTVQLV